MGDSLPEPTPAHWWGTQGLRTFFIFGALGFPLLIAFGLGVLMWIYAVGSALVCGVVGLVRDRERGRAAASLLLALLVIGGAVANRYAGR